MSGRQRSLSKCRDFDSPRLVALRDADSHLTQTHTKTSWTTTCILTEPWANRYDSCSFYLVGLVTGSPTAIVMSPDPTAQGYRRGKDKRARPDASLPTDRPRKRVALACATCRGRKTKCDSRIPSCSYCVKHGLQCRYEPNSVVRYVVRAFDASPHQRK